MMEEFVALKIEPVMVAVLLAGLIIGAAIQYLISRSRIKTLALTQRATKEQRLAELRAQIAVLETQQDHLSDQLEARQLLLDERDTTIEKFQQDLSARSEQNASLQATLAQERRQAEEKLQLLKDAKEQLAREFETLANRIFEEKSERFSKNSKQTLDGAINPLREQLSDFKKKVEDVYDKESKERVSLLTELGHLKELNQQMSKDAVNLTRALKGDSKIQGNWGEVILERVLEESGLRKGHEYITQVALKHESGRSRSPDVIVHLPDNRDIVVDAKVSLVAYERYCNSESEEEKKLAAKQHVASVREHIQSLSIKEYENLEGIQTLDFVFIFIPIEAAFMTAFEQDKTLFMEAYEKNIIVVSPTTLLASLRTVQSMWRYERQNKNAQEIARQAGALHDKFVNFVNDLEDLGKHLDRATNAQQEAVKKLSQGRGNLVGSIQRLEKLGAKTRKKIPESVLDHVDEADSLLASSESDDEKESLLNEEES